MTYALWIACGTQGFFALAAAACNAPPNERASFAAVFTTLATITGIAAWGWPS